MPGPEDFFLNCGASIARDLVCGAIRETRYCCYFNNLAEELEKDMMELQKHEKRVEERVARTKNETKKIEDDDKDWLEETGKLEKQMKQLEAKVEKYKSCFGRCPNWICHYLLGRQLTKMKDIVKLHCDKRPKYGGIERLATLPSMEYFSSDNFMKFQSRQSAFEQLIKAIKDDGVSMIGLCGIGGCGKTTLAKEIGKEAEKLFNYKPAFVVVSSNEVRSIQNQIASWIQIKLTEEEETERARRLWMRLSHAKERFLIILDDVRGNLNFEAIGIPLGGNCKDCKVLMTTRSLSICNLMDCQPKISLSILSFNESWDLFQKHAHIADETFGDREDLAKKITEKCNGLPVAIAAVASTLKGKTLVEWEVALNRLEESRPVELEAGLRDPYGCLELSYENLTSEEAKSLFLLCSAFPKDWKIPYDVIMIGSGLGLFGSVKSSAKRRNQGMVAKNILINSCLLLEAEDDKEFECVRMHDLVHDVAFWIANKDNKVIRRIGRKEKPSEDLTPQDTQIRYLWCDKFPNKLDSTTLDFLCFSTDSEHGEIPSEFFERQNRLRVLILANDSSKKMLQLPNSMQRLTNLRCLVLFGWELNDISFLENLNALESLALQKCRFRELPIAIGQLINLSMLNVSECEIERDPLEVITGCSELEELYFTRNKVFDWKFDQETAAEFLNKLSTPKKLLNYKIELKRAVVEEFDLAFGSLLRSLVIEYFDASMSNATVMDLMRKTEALSLGHINGGCRNIIPDIFQRIGGCMTELIQLCLHDSKEIECLIENNDLECHPRNLFSKLSKLCIREMENLKALYHGRPSPGFFWKLEEVHVYGCNQLHGLLFLDKSLLSSLKVLKLKGCPKLTSLFTPNSARSLLHLQNLQIERCNQLKHVITDKLNEDLIEEDNGQGTNELPFQRLKQLVVWDCNRLEYTIPLSCAHGGLEQLEIINITIAHELKFIFGPHTHSAHLADPVEIDFQVKLPNLKQLHLDSLPNIVSICPENYYPVWPALCKFNLRGCPHFTIVHLNKCEVSSKVNQHLDPRKETGLFIGHGNPKGSEMSCLETLCLDDLEELSYICKGPIQIMSLQSLILLEIYNCRKFKSVFSTCSFGSMPQLEELRISHCDELEQIITDEGHQNITNSRTDSCPRSTSNSSKLDSGAGSRTILQTAGGISEHSVLSLCGMRRTRSPCPTRLVPTSGGSMDTLQATGGSLNLCNLKQMKVQNCPMMKSLFTLSTVRILIALEKLEVSMCHGLKEIITCESSYEHEREESCFQSHILFPKLKDLNIEHCNSLGCIFPISFTEGLMKLECINICGIPQLKSLFPPFTAKVLTSLKILEIEECHGLKEIITCESAHECKSQEIIQYDSGKESHISLLFPELEHVSIENCNSLKCAFVVSFIQGLPKLRFIGIHQAPQLQYLFGDDSLEYTSSHQYENMIQIIKLPLLEYLSFEDLPNLISICPSNCYVECPSLQEILLDLIGPSNSTTNNGVRTDDRRNYCSTKDLGAVTVKPVQGSTTLEHSDSEDKFSWRKKDLLLISNKVTSRYEMVFSCMSPQCLLNLQDIEVKGCGKLTALFSVSVLRSLPQLRELMIIECEELEQITVEDEENEDISNSCSQEVCFPELKVLIIKGCNKLKRLFSISTSLEFPKLESIIIIEAAQLRQVFEGGKGETEELGEVVLPELKHLMLVRLPSLTSACGGVKIPLEPYYIVENYQYLSLTTAPRKSVEDFRYERKGSHINWDVYVELHDQLCNRPTTSLVSNSTEIEEQSWRKSGSQDTKETCKGIIGETKKITEISQGLSTSSDQNVIEVREGILKEKADTIISSTDLESQDVTEEEQQDFPINKANTVAFLHESSPQVLVKKDLRSKPFLMDQQTIQDREITNDAPDIPSNLAKHAIKPENNNAPKVALEEITMETALPKLKSSSPNQSDSSWNKKNVVDGKQEGLATKKAKEITASSQIFSNTALNPINSTSTILLAELSTRPRIDEFFTSKEFLGSTPILECRTESLNVEQKANFREGQEEFRYLERNLFESCAEEVAVDMEIQHLIIRKMEILEQRNSLASQLNQSTEAISKDYAEWKAMREKLKVSIGNWLKLKEDLARANASWGLFKESIGL